MKTSYEKTADAQLRVGATKFWGIQVITDSTNDATAIVYDVASSGDAAAGNKVGEYKVAGADEYGGVIFPQAVDCVAGLYVDITGTGASYIAYYKKG